MNINNKCYCGKLNEKKNIISFYPCCHLIHQECYNKLKNKNKCYICKSKIDEVINLEKCKKFINTNKYKEIYSNILSQSFDDVQINYYLLIIRFIDIIILLLSSYFIKSKKDLNKWINRFFKLCDIKIKILNKENNKNIKKVYISNHTSHIDFLVLYSVHQSGFLHNDTGLQFLKKINLENMYNLFNKDLVKVEKNTVKSLKKFMKHHDSIIIFPEGQRNNSNTLCKFGTGAFNVGYPIQPLIIKCNKNIYHRNLSDFIKYIFTNENIIFTIDYLDIEYPAFDKIKIENIRDKMAKKGDLFKSNLYYK